MTRRKIIIIYCSVWQLCTEMRTHMWAFLSSYMLTSCSQSWHDLYGLRYVSDVRYVSDIFDQNVGCFWYFRKYPDVFHPWLFRRSTHDCVDLWTMKVVVKLKHTISCLCNWACANHRVCSCGRHASHCVQLHSELVARSISVQSSTRQWWATNWNTLAQLRLNIN